MAQLRVVAHGKAAHSGNHHRDGANAIWALARVLVRASALGDLRVISAEGGTSRNTVPDRAEASIEAPSDVAQVVRGLTSEIPGTSIQIDVADA